MSIFAISDLHLSTKMNKPMDIFGDNWEGHWDIIRSDWAKKVQENDIVLIAGDISWGMKIDEAEEDLAQIRALAGKKIILRGNHDYWWSSINKVRQTIGESMFAVQNDCIKIENSIFCGTRGWVIAEENASDDDKKIYKREIDRLRLSLKDMERKRKEGDVVIGMMHYPPFNAKYESTPFTQLFKEFGVDTVIYGHLHGKKCRHEKEVIVDGVKFILTSCDLIDHKLVKLI